MKKFTKKCFSCFIVACLSMACCFVSFANDNFPPGEIPKNSVYANLPDPFDPNVQFSEIENGIKDFILTRELGIEVGSEAYVDLMYSFLYGEIENISDITERYFYDYASVYVVEVQKTLAMESKRAKSNEDKTFDIELNGTIEEIKQKNSDAVNSMLQIPENQPAVQSANFNLSKAQAYAQAYAHTWNPVYGHFSSDCTNFASQILHAAGMPMVAGRWQYNGNEMARNTWNVAHYFMEYFGSERGYAYGGYTTKAQVNANARPGDFLGYMANDTNTIWHVCFVQSKSGGKIYITQHTRDTYNEKWDNINITNPSTYVINRF